LLGVVALKQLRNAAGELHDLDAARHLALRVGEHLAVLGGDQVRELVAVPVEQFQELEHHARPTQRRRPRPGREGGSRSPDRPIHLGCRGQRHLAGDDARGRVGDGLRTTRCTGQRAALEVVADVGRRGGHGWCLQVKREWEGVAGRMRRRTSHLLW
jgi:hypothetical protein